MRVTNGMRWSGAAGLVGGLTAIALTPDFATAFYLAYPGENARPFWLTTVESRRGASLRFADPVDVYAAYGRLYNVVYLLFMPLVLALHRAQRGSGSVPERRGYVVLMAGLAATALGVAGDYWANGVGFPLEVLGLLAMSVGVTMWGLAARRGDLLPRAWAWPFIICGPGAVATAALVGHVPSGPTLSFAIAWALVGTMILTHRRPDAAVRT